MLVGYNIYYLDEEFDELFFLHLSYATMDEAQQALAILEQVYGEGKLVIDVASLTPHYGEYAGDRTAE